MSPEDVGRLVPLLVGLGFCALCAMRALRAEQRSRRLALAGMACAVTVLPIAAGAFLLGSAERPAVFGVAGLFAVVAGMAAVVLALRAKGAKQTDRGVGSVTPAAALVLGIAGGLLGVWLIAFPPAAGP